MKALRTIRKYSPSETVSHPRRLGSSK